MVTARKTAFLLWLYLYMCSVQQKEGSYVHCWSSKGSGPYSTAQKWQIRSAWLFSYCRINNLCTYCVWLQSSFEISCTCSWRLLLWADHIYSDKSTVQQFCLINLKLSTAIDSAQSLDGSLCVLYALVNLLVWVKYSADIELSFASVYICRVDWLSIGTSVSRE